MHQFCVVCVREEHCGDAFELELSVDMTRLTINFAKIDAAAIGFFPDTSSLHFVSVCLNPSVGEAARCGFWLPSSGMHIIQCDAYNETVKYVPSDANIALYDDTRKKLFGERKIPLCEPKQTDLWDELTSDINYSVLQNCSMGEYGTLLVPGTNDIAVLPQSEKDLTEMAPFFGASAGRTPVWTKLWPNTEEMKTFAPEKVTAFGYNGSERMKWIAGNIKMGTADTLIGELQLCYVHFLLFASMSALTQWKALLQLFCTLDPDTDNHILTAFINTVKTQLSHGDIASLLEEEKPLDLFTECFGSLYDALRSHFRKHSDKGLENAAERLKKMLINKCDFDPDTNSSNKPAVVIKKEKRRFNGPLSFDWD